MKKSKISRLSENRSGQRRGGFTLMEVLIAMAIFSIGILSVVYLQWSAVSSNNQSRRYTEAAAIAQGRIDTLLSVPFDDMGPEVGNTAGPGGYLIRTTIQNPAVLGGDGMTVRVVVDDPSGAERARIDFLKVRNI